MTLNLTLDAAYLFHTFTFTLIAFIGSGIGLIIQLQFTHCHYEAIMIYLFPRNPIATIEFLPSIVEIEKSNWIQIQSRKSKNANIEQIKYQFHHNSSFVFHNQNRRIISIESADLANMQNLNSIGGNRFLVSCYVNNIITVPSSINFPLFQYK